MKTSLLKNLSLFSLLLFLISSCEKEEIKVTANSEGQGATLTASATTLTLDKVNADKQAVTFTWTKADFGFDAALTNTLQIDLAGNNFSSPKEVVFAGGVNSKSFTVIELNALLLSMSLPTGANSDIQVRVKSEVTGTDALEPVYSNAVNMKVNPYALVSFVYVPGAYQGWNPATADSLISATSNGIYIGIINFTAGSTEFKITPAKKWDVAYGDAGGGSISTSAGNNLKVPGPGMYRLTADLNNNTFEATKYSWGVIGSATAGGWDSDTDMMYNNGKQEWTLTTNLSVGEIKFRLNDAWDTNYGGTGGTLAKGGDNIAITSAGTYKITMNLAANTYSVVKL